MKALVYWQGICWAVTVWLLNCEVVASSTSVIEFLSSGTSEAISVKYLCLKKSISVSVLPWKRVIYIIIKPEICRRNLKFPKYDDLQFVKIFYLNFQSSKL